MLEAKGMLHLIKIKEQPFDNSCSLEPLLHLGRRNAQHIGRGTDGHDRKVYLFGFCLQFFFRHLCSI